jgi:hypothetical protein
MYFMFSFLLDPAWAGIDFGGIVIAEKSIGQDYSQHDSWFWLYNLLRLPAKHAERICARSNWCKALYRAVALSRP